MNILKQTYGREQPDQRQTAEPIMKAVKIGNGRVTGSMLGGFAAHYYLLDLYQPRVFPEVRVSTDLGFAGLSYQVLVLKNGIPQGPSRMITQSGDDPAFFLDGSAGDALLVGVRNMTAHTIAYNVTVKQLGVPPSREACNGRFGSIYMQSMNMERQFTFRR